MKRNQLLAIFCCILFIVSCSKDQLDIPENNPGETPELLSKNEVDKIVLDKLKAENEFKWSMVSDQVVWSAIVHSGGVTAVGYRAEGYGDLSEIIHEIDIKKPEWIKSKEQIFDWVEKAEGKAREDLIDLAPSEYFPSLDLKLSDFNLVKKLRNSNIVRYVEPMNFNLDAEIEYARSSAGCGVTPASYITPYDYTTISPYVKRPWNFTDMKIKDAWNTSQGDNITIALIDTGTSPSQPKLGSQFSSGQSTGRYISRHGTYVSSWWPWANPDGPDDDCGHGTQMAGVIAAPRGYNGTAVGTAYKCNLMAIRGTGDVLINSGREKDGVRDALFLAANNSSVKVISMSIGNIFWSSTVADGVYYAYNKGKMIMAAAGTSTWFTSWVGVIFPARMSQTVAVTGVKEYLPLQKCNTCHSGSKVDFVSVMQRRYNNSRTTLTLALSGNQPAYVGGSSAATATMAGIAGMVWATNPYQSRATVLQRLKNASQYYPSRNGSFGWGLVDANQAVQ